MASALTRAQAFEKIEDLEQELHEANNSAEYWSHEYHTLLRAYDNLRYTDNPILEFLNSSSIIDQSKVEDFIKTLK